MSVIKTIPISLRAFEKAVDAHGFEKVIARLINSEHVKQTEKGILHVLSKMPLPQDDDCEDPTPEPTVPVDDRKNDRFIECMNVLNDKLCKATISKDYAMINTIVVSMTNVTKSL